MSIFEREKWNEQQAMATETIYTLSAPRDEEIFNQLSWFQRSRVKAARVLVVGCGALGNEVLKNLVLFGVEQLVLVDFDQVEPSNLTRSLLFTPEDAEHHTPKVEAAARSLRRLNPALQLQLIRGDITHDVGLGLLRQVDVAIGCVDNRWARFYLNRLCMRAGIPWVDGGIHGLEGTVRVFQPGQNCYACNLGPEGQQELARHFSCANLIRRNETAGRAATTPVVAALIAAVQVQEAMKLIHRDEIATGRLTSLCGKMFYYEGEHLTSRLVQFAGYDAECPEHDRWEPVQPTPLTHQATVAEALAQLRQQLHWPEATLLLMDHTFVDYLIDRTTDQRIDVGLPDYAVEAFITTHPRGSQLPLQAFYQHEISRVDDQFPCPDLTLQALGIPDREVLVVEQAHEQCYIELTGCQSINH